MSAVIWVQSGTFFACNRVTMRTRAKFDPPLTLYQAESNATLKILLISGDWTVRRSFNQMGVHTGDRIRILFKAPFGGPLVIENHGTRVAVGKQLAENVRVEVLP
jgi:Fe2+ transport system protein FeoA